MRALGLKAVLMETAGPSSDREPLAGLVERISFHNGDSGFCVLRVKARGHRDLVTVLGATPSIAAGEQACHENFAQSQGVRHRARPLPSPRS